MIGRIFTGRELNLILRLFLGGMFVYAAWDKVLEPSSFAMAVRGYKIIPFSLSNLFALCVSWAELVAGIMLILGVFPRKAAGAIAILLVMFIVAIITTLVRGMVVDCGCFGKEGGSSTSWLLIVRNLLLLAGTYIVMAYNDGFLCVFPGARRSEARPVASRRLSEY
ncbi:MAG TPA: MauE/DoxX family redox-associated membrane protein [Candidatus Krumholzibacteria bacterium]|nr:MauE/DoxX family redox-associated membrane protein [Candidatus Krumholzibacteria bacterium]